MAHHQGMSLLPLAYLLLDRPMQKRFESDPLFQATVLLLQERIPKATAFFSQAAEISGLRRTSDGTENADSRFHQPGHSDTGAAVAFEWQIPRDGHERRRWIQPLEEQTRRHALGERQAPATNWGMFCYIRDAPAGTSGPTAYQPTHKGLEKYEAIFSEARAEFRCRDHDMETHTEIGFSPEDDIELRRITVTNRSRAAG